MSDLVMTLSSDEESDREDIGGVESDEDDSNSTRSSAEKGPLQGGFFRGIMGDDHESFIAPYKSTKLILSEKASSLNRKIQDQLETKKIAKKALRLQKKADESAMAQEEGEGDGDSEDENDEDDEKDTDDSDDELCAHDEYKKGPDDKNTEKDVEEDSDDDDAANGGEVGNVRTIKAKRVETGKNMFDNFSDLKLSRPLVKAVKEMGFTKPTPVQAEAIPLALTGADILVNAMTGSGKTAAFMLPILERLLYRPRRNAMTRVLVITPTRELAEQIMQVTTKLAQFTDIRIASIVGGVSLSNQETLLRSYPDVVVATPGRLVDHLNNSRAVHLDDVDVLVLDEADRLLELGFADEVKEIVSNCPRGRQTMLFSATLTERVQDIVNLSLNKPKRISIDPENSIVDRLTQEFVRIRTAREHDREAIVLALCKRTFKNKTIVFVKSKVLTHRLMLVFGLAKLKAAELHGNLTQAQRLEALELFRRQEVDFLLCTDLASRGLDIKGVETVVNMDMPRELAQYIHRVGRTARAGAKGRSVTLVGDHQRKLLREIIKRARDVVRSRAIPVEVVKKFRDMIDDMRGDIDTILEKEREERAFRIAEMEANKAENMLNHEDAIYARPKRTWFQTAAEKENVKNSTDRLFEVLGGAGAKGGKGDGKGGSSATEDEEGAEDGNGKKKKKEKDAKPKVKSLEEQLRGLSREKRRRKMFMIEAEKQREEMKREAEEDEAQRKGSDTKDKKKVSKRQMERNAAAAEDPEVVEARRKEREKNRKVMDLVLNPTKTNSLAKKEMKRKSREAEMEFFRDEDGQEENGNGQKKKKQKREENFYHDDESIEKSMQRKKSKKIWKASASIRYGGDAAIALDQMKAGSNEKKRFAEADRKVAMLEQRLGKEAKSSKKPQTSKGGFHSKKRHKRR